MELSTLYQPKIHTSFFSLTTRVTTSIELLTGNFSLWKECWIKNHSFHCVHRHRYSPKKLKKKILWTTSSIRLTFLPSYNVIIFHQGFNWPVKSCKRTRDWEYHRLFLFALNCFLPEIAKNTATDFDKLLLFQLILSPIHWQGFLFRNPKHKLAALGELFPLN